MPEEGEVRSEARKEGREGEEKSACCTWHFSHARKFIVRGIRGRGGGGATGRSACYTLVAVLP